LEEQITIGTSGQMPKQRAGDAGSAGFHSKSTPCT
jgi:hypothetical protein